MNDCTKKFEQNMLGLFPYCPDDIKFAVAVSGGSDSMCMLELARIWAQKTKAKIFVVVIDHGMRKFNSEINLIEDFCKKNKLFCQIIKWNYQGTIESNIQARAREARYKLISDFCKENDIFYTLVGHHVQDFVENFVMRLARKSGAFAFSIDKTSIANDVIILRPLFNFTKVECVNFLMENKISWVEDPTNKNTKFARNNIRALFENFNNANPQFSLLALESVSNIFSTLSIVQEAFLEAFLKCIVTSSFGYMVLKLDEVKLYNIEIQYMLFYYALGIVRGSKKLPRMHKVRDLHNNIIKKQISSAATLHGCKICILDGKCIMIYRLFGLQKLESIILQNGLVWDERFKFNYEGVYDHHHEFKSFIIKGKPIEASSIKKIVKNICKIDNNNYISCLKSTDAKEFINSFPSLEIDGSMVGSDFTSEGLIFFIEKFQLKIRCIFHPELKPKILYLPF